VGQLPLYHSGSEIILGKILLRLPCSKHSLLGVMGNGGLSWLLVRSWGMVYCQVGRLGLRYCQDYYFVVISEMYHKLGPLYLQCYYCA
jgi:hypothetical protein